jgi:hypothetical protein
MATAMRDETSLAMGTMLLLLTNGNKNRGSRHSQKPVESQAGHFHNEA